MKKNKWRARILNLVFFGLLLFFLISTPAKSWLLRQLIRTGIYKAKIENSTDSLANTATMPLSYTNEQGQSMSTENLEGKVVLINFWATWCPPCRAEMPSINKLYNSLKDDGKIVFIFINMDDQLSVAKKYLLQNGISIPLHRAQGFIPTEIYNGTLPTTVVINKKGNIVMKHQGMADYSAPGFITQLESLK